MLTGASTLISPFRAIISSMHEFKAVLFDLDGTLLDTKEFIFQAYEYTLDKHGLPAKDRSEIAALIGKPLGTVYDILVPGADKNGLCDTHRLFQSEHLDLSKPYPGTKKTLETLKFSGLKLAVVTTRAKATAVKTLELAHVLEYIDHVVGLEDVVNLKPHPEPLLKALDRLGEEPVNAVMVGDADVDVLAGKNAGTATIGVTYGFHGKTIINSEPDWVVDDIEEIIPLVLPALEYARESTTPSNN